MSKQHRDCKNKQCVLCQSKVDIDNLVKTAYAEKIVYTMPIIDANYAFSLGARMHVPELLGEFIVTMLPQAAAGTLMNNVIGYIRDNKIDVKAFEDGYVFDKKLIKSNVDFKVLLAPEQVVQDLLGSANRLTCVPKSKSAYILLWQNERGKFSKKCIQDQLEILGLSIEDDILYYKPNNQ